MNSCKHDLALKLIEAYAPKFSVIRDPSSSPIAIELKCEEVVFEIIGHIAKGCSMARPEQILSNGEFLGYQVVIAENSISPAPGKKVFIATIHPKIGDSSLSRSICESASVAQLIIALAIEAVVGIAEERAEETKKKETETELDKKRDERLKQGKTDDPKE